MLSIEEVYEDVALDTVNTAENGQLSYAMFNRLSRRAELRLMDFLTGDIENIKPPSPYTTQKLRDILSQFIVKKPAQVENGSLVRPKDYYEYDSMFVMGDAIQDDEDCEDDKNDGCNTTIEVLENDKFDQRCKTYIEGLRPSMDKPIAKMVGRSFEFNPKDLGSVILQYIRYPVFGRIVSKLDEVYNREVIDTSKSANYEYDNFARELLVYFIADTFATHTRENALKQHNNLTGKLIRDAK